VRRSLLALPVLGALAGVLASVALATSGPRTVVRPVTGTVRGTLVATGGPAGTSDRPLSGAVYFVDAGGRSTAAAAGADGTFRVTLATGRYRVEGRSPSVGSGEGFPCTAGPVTVRPRATTTVAVVCPRK